jgi:hypothetical protein
MYYLSVSLIVFMSDHNNLCFEIVIAPLHNFTKFKLLTRLRHELI